MFSSKLCNSYFKTVSSFFCLFVCFLEILCFAWRFKNWCSAGNPGFVYVLKILKYPDLTLRAEELEEQLEQLELRGSRSGRSSRSIARE